MQASVDTSALKERLAPLVEKYPRYFMLVANFLGRDRVWGYIQVKRGGKDEIEWSENYTHR